MRTPERGIVLLLLFVCAFFSQTAAKSYCGNKYMYYSDSDNKCHPCLVCYGEVDGRQHKSPDCPREAQCAKIGVLIGCPELEYTNEDKHLNCTGFSYTKDKRRYIFDSKCYAECNETESVALVCQFTKVGSNVTGQWKPRLPSCVRPKTPKIPEPLPQTSPRDPGDGELSSLTILVLAVCLGIGASVLVSVSVFLLWKRKRRMVAQDQTEELPVEEPRSEERFREGQEHEDETLRLNQEVLQCDRLRNRSSREPLLEPTEEQDSVYSLGIERGEPTVEQDSVSSLGIARGEPVQEQDSLCSLGIARGEEAGDEDVRPKVLSSAPVQVEWSCESCSSLSSPGSTSLYAGGDSSTSGVGSVQSSLTSSREPDESSDIGVTSSGISYDSSVTEESSDIPMTYSGISYDSSVTDALRANRVATGGQHPRNVCQNRCRTASQHPEDVIFVRNIHPQENEASFSESNVALHDIERGSGDQSWVHQYHSNHQTLLSPDWAMNCMTRIPREHYCSLQGSHRTDDGSRYAYSLPRPRHGTNMATEHTHHVSASSLQNSVYDN